MRVDSHDNDHGDEANHCDCSQSMNHIFLLNHMPLDIKSHLAVQGAHACIRPSLSYSEVMSYTGVSVSIVQETSQILVAKWLSYIK